MVHIPLGWLKEFAGKCEARVRSGGKNESGIAGSMAGRSLRTCSCLKNKGVTNRGRRWDYEIKI